jgi:hypothetical protein
MKRIVAGREAHPQCISVFGPEAPGGVLRPEVLWTPGQLPLGPRCWQIAGVLTEGIQRIRTARLAKGNESRVGVHITHVHRVFAWPGQVHGLRSRRPAAGVRARNAAAGGGQKRLRAAKLGIAGQGARTCSSAGLHGLSRLRPVAPHGPRRTEREQRSPAPDSPGRGRVAPGRAVGEFDGMICVAGTAGEPCEFLGGGPIESTFGRVGGRAWGCPGSCQPWPR